ncbi:MAG TPA: S41 family peptidase [Longimicrobiales bacterium]|nr:S41 family peptidase [Longimicrobiales bacterium]
MKRSFLTPLVVALVALSTGGWFLQQGVSPDRNVYTQARLFEEVMEMVQQRFVDEEDEAALYDMAITGLLDELGDPHSTLMNQKDYAELQVQTRGEYGGLGIQIAVRDDWVTIITPMPGTPAERAGLMPGDRIIEVEGESTEGWSEDKAVSVLRGPKGKPVDIKIARAGVEEPMPFTVQREEITVSAVPAAYMLDGSVGYVQMNVFSETSAADLQAAIDGLRADGMDRLILDMRANPGGVLEQAFAVADLFVERGDAILETRGRTAVDNQRFLARSADQYPGLPIVVLVNGASASATEIVAGALQDQDRALVLGSRTFGKGSVQSLFPLRSGNYFLKLTTARWYTPSGRSIQAPYGVGDGRERIMGDARADIVSVDTLKDEVFLTEGGREVKGGGGILPDLEIRDTLSEGEQAYVQLMTRNGGKFFDALYGFAFEHVRTHPELGRAFPVDEAMYDGFYEALRARDVDVERAVYDGAREWVAQQLAYRIAYTKWNQAEAVRRFNAGDRQIQVAAELLRQARSPESLFSLARAWQDQGARQASGTPPGGR